MNILVVNDDGIDAYGIKLLFKALEKYGTTFMVAPLVEQSANSHSLTIRDSFKVEKRSERVYGINGTPADCVKFAQFMFEEEFDLVVSGINDGPNLGNDIFYSGTVGGATEGTFYDIPSIAISIGSKNDFRIAEAELETILDYVINNNLLDKQVVLNINFPHSKYLKSKGIKYTKQGIRKYETTFSKADGTYKNSGSLSTANNDDETDVYAWENGFVSITPLLVNRSHTEYLSKLKKRG